MINTWLPARHRKCVDNSGLFKLANVTKFRLPRSQTSNESLTRGLIIFSTYTIWFYSSRKLGGKLRTESSSLDVLELTPHFLSASPFIPLRPLLHIWQQPSSGLASRSLNTKFLSTGSIVKLLEKLLKREILNRTPELSK